MPDIEVTDEMIEAGVATLDGYFTAFGPERVVAAIYRAMRAKERESEDAAYGVPYVDHRWDMTGTGMSGFKVGCLATVLPRPADEKAMTWTMSGDESPPPLPKGQEG